MWRNRFVSRSVLPMTSAEMFSPALSPWATVLSPIMSM